MPNRYSTIVADPPWSYPEGWPVSKRGFQAAVRQGVPNPDRNFRTRPYAMLSVEDISALPVSDWAERNAHLYLWTTNRYLPDVFGVVKAWGFRYAQTIPWCKTPMGMGPGGTWAQTVEYVIFARRGSLRSLTRHESCWFNWPRMGASHSRKPEAFLDMVETTSPGPYLEMFARRARLGWDTWGNEALHGTEMVA